MSEKFGAGHGKAWLRAGAKEASQALVAFPSSSIHLIEEPGLVGTATQNEINTDRGNMVSYDQYLQSKAPVREPPAPEQQLGRER